MVQLVGRGKSKVHIIRFLLVKIIVASLFKCYFQILLQYDPNYLLCVGRLNRTPLHFAVYYGHLKIIEYLLQRNISLSAVDSSGLTPLMTAAISCHVNAPRIIGIFSMRNIFYAFVPSAILYLMASSLIFNFMINYFISSISIF